jgi:redox-sensing transcriptional repressor
MPARPARPAPLRGAACAGRSSPACVALTHLAASGIFDMRGGGRARHASIVLLCLASFWSRRMEQPRSDLVPNPAVKRLSLYLRQLEAFKKKDRRTISSKQLGESLGLTDAQVRKDFAYFGQFGHPGIGYRVDDLIGQVRRILGTDKTWNVLLVGAGNLGRALMAYRGFDQKGFRLAAVFDADGGKVGKRQASFTIQPLDELAATVREKNIRLAILAVPADNAQEVADQLVEAGIRGLLNFAPVSITVPPDVALNAVDLAVQLEQLSFQVSLSFTNMAS